MHEQQPSNNPAEHEPGHEQQEKLRPAVYAVSVLDHVRGLVHGVWLHADVSTGELMAGVDEMLRRSPTALHLAERTKWWTIRDFAGFGPLRLTTAYDDPHTFTAVARGISQHGHGFAAWARLVGPNAERLVEFEDNYLGEWESVEAYAADFLDSAGESAHSDPAAVDRLARSLEACGEIRVVRGFGDRVWLFRPDVPPPPDEEPSNQQEGGENE